MSGFSENTPVITNFGVWTMRDIFSHVQKTDALPLYMYTAQKEPKKVLSACILENAPSTIIYMENGQILCFGDETSVFITRDGEPDTLVLAKDVGKHLPCSLKHAIRETLSADMSPKSDAWWVAGYLTASTPVDIFSTYVSLHVSDELSGRVVSALETDMGPCTEKASDGGHVLIIMSTSQLGVFLDKYSFKKITPEKEMHMVAYVEGFCTGSKNAQSRLRHVQTILAMMNWLGVHRAVHLYAKNHIGFAHAGLYGVKAIGQTTDTLIDVRVEGDQFQVSGVCVQV